MSWKPISEADLLELINRALDQFAPAERRFWETIRTDPEKWQCSRWGDEGQGFWAVAVLGKSVVWYNDIEDGFNCSRYRTFGAFDDYCCDQATLDQVVRVLKRDVGLEYKSIASKSPAFEVSMATVPTTTLWRPVGPEELKLIQDADMREFPPRLPEQPIFYPVLTEEYAIKIARDWNVKANGSGYVTRFEVLTAYLDGYEVQEAGGRAHLEYWIPAEDLDAFNNAIVGKIVITQKFP